MRAASQDPWLKEVVAAIDAACEEELQGVVCNVLQSEETRERVTRETGKDPVLSRVLQRIAGGWTPGDKRDFELRPFVLLADDLCVTDGTLLYGDRIVVPRSVRAKRSGVLRSKIFPQNSSLGQISSAREG